MVTAYGMCAAIGPRCVSGGGGLGAALMGGGGSREPPPPSAALAEAVDEQVSLLLRRADGWASACVAANDALLLEMADVLLVRC